MARPRTRRAAKESREKAERAVAAENGGASGSKPDPQEAAAQQPPEQPGDAAPLSEGKRARSGDGSTEPARQEKRQKTEEGSKPARILRPGIPKPVSTTAYVFPDRPSGPDRGDDGDGHYQFQLGDNLTSRYKILSKMGEGTFGRVLECWDRRNKAYVAIKIVRNIQKYRDAAMIELEVLNTLAANDAAGCWHCVRLREWFNYRGHVCMVFEKLGLSLYDFLRKNGYRPFSADLVRSFGRQLLQSVAYLHSLTLIHTDLKPENILLASLEYDKVAAPRGARKPLRVPRESAIKVIDFGSATFDDQYHSTIVSTRHYRAPEVILGLGWTYPADIWSIGCILVELATGCALFQTHENLEHLAMMQQVLGPVPESMAVAAVRQARAQERPGKAGGSSSAAAAAKTGPVKYFTSRYRLNWPEGASNKKSVQAVQKLAGLRSLLSDLGDPSVRPWLEPLVDLLRKMLRYEPSARIRARQALEHEFFREAVSRPLGPADAGEAGEGGEVIVLED